MSPAPRCFLRLRFGSDVALRLVARGFCTIPIWFIVVLAVFMPALLRLFITVFPAVFGLAIIEPTTRGALF